MKACTEIEINEMHIFKVHMYIKRCFVPLLLIEFLWKQLLHFFTFDYPLSKEIISSSSIMQVNPI